MVSFDAHTEPSRLDERPCHPHELGCLLQGRTGCLDLPFDVWAGDRLLQGHPHQALALVLQVLPRRLELGEQGLGQLGLLNLVGAQQDFACRLHGVCNM